jgi:predicted nucleic acid-binding protein
MKSASVPVKQERKDRSKDSGVPNQRNKSMVHIWFIDTNVVASWIIAESTLLEKLSKYYKFPDGYRELYRQKYQSEVELINSITSMDKTQMPETNEFYISFLSTNELFSAIRDEIVSLILFNNGEPISRWPGLKSSIILTDKQAQLTYKTILKKMGYLFENNVKMILDWDEEQKNSSYWDIASSFLFKLKNTKTQDTMLLTTAILNSADFFVTRDERLIKESQEILQTAYNLKVIKPETARLKLKH